MRRLKTSLIAAVCGLGLALSGCSGSSSSGSADKPKSDAKGAVRLWLMEGSVSDDAQKVLKEKFEKDNPGSTLNIEIQQWDGIIAKMQTALASSSESPDVIETGTTQTSTLTSVGALAPVDDLYDEVGGKDLIEAFVDAGSWDGKKYALPLYAGARGLFYRKDLFEKAGLELPKTLSELRDTVIKLKEANPDNVDGFSGIYLAATDAHSIESYVFAKGGEYAVKEGDQWKGQLSSPKTQEALQDIQQLFQEGTTYALDSQAGQKQFENYFNEGKAGMLLATGNIGTKIDKKLWDEDKVGVFALPSETPGTAGSSFLGGSNVSISKNAQNVEGAKSLMKAIFSEEFQKQIAKDGWAPGNVKYADQVSGAFGEISQDVIKNAKVTPNTPQWGVGAPEALHDLYVEIAKGGDVKQLGEKYDQTLNDLLNKK